MDLTLQTSGISAPVGTGELDITLDKVFQGLGDEDGEGGSEVVAHEGGKLYVTNGAQGRVDVWDIEADSGDVPEMSIDLTGIKNFDSIQSVAVSHGLVAAAVSLENREVDDGVLARKGVVVFADAETGEIIETVKVGVLPDSIAFTPDGTKLIVANEAEFNEDSLEDGVKVNPKGSISIISIDKGDDEAPGQAIGHDDDNGKANGKKFAIGHDDDAPAAPFEDYDFSEKTLFFNKFNGEGMLGEGVRISPDFNANRDIEPEYVTVSPDGTTAYVTLQENNAVALVDLETHKITEVRSLGTVDYSDPARAADFTDGDDTIEFITADAIGMRMADAIAVFEIDGMTYYATANEGDGRGDAPDFDEARVEDVIAGDIPGVSFDPSVDTTGLERLKISVVDGDTDGDGDIDQITSCGSRSFTIFNEDGDVVYDSENELERIIATEAPFRFLDDDGDDGQDRADDKGAEPEAIEVGVIDGETYLFVGLERDSSVVVYNISDPTNAQFVEYLDGFASGNLGPETIDFIAADDTEDGIARIAVAYEISSTTVVYTLEDLIA